MITYRGTFCRKVESNTVMDEGFKFEETKRGFSPVLILGALIGVAIIGAAIFLLSFKPPMEQQTAKILEGAIREDSPEFAAISKTIIIATDDRTVESPTGMGTISMYIHGIIKNIGSKNITALEVNVGVITQKNEVLREKRVLVVPTQHPSLPAGESIPITLDIPGFDRKDDRANIRWKVTAIKTAD